MSRFDATSTGPPAVTSPTEALSPLSPVNILLVDDDQRNLDSLESILERPDYRLVRAQSAEAALRALMVDDFAALVLDIRMPGTSGLELAQLIKGRRKTHHLPIIFLTAYFQQDEHVLQGYDAGGVDYLSKPCNPAILRSKVAVFVDLFRKSQALEGEVTRRQKVEEDLRQAYQTMEARVRARTAELEQANDVLTQREEELRQAREMLEQKVIERTTELREKADQLRMMACELARAKEHERKRLAQHLHDGLQQLLVAARMRASTVAVSTADAVAAQARVSQIRQQIREVVAILDDAIKTSRSLTAELSPPILYDVGLIPALEWLSRWMEEKHHMKVEVLASPEAEPPAEPMRVLLFDTARELLFNVVKHAEVNAATVQLEKKGEDRIVLVIEDQGRGFEPSKHMNGAMSDGFGLVTLRERIGMVAGEMEISSRPGAGVAIRVSVPRGPSAVVPPLGITEALQDPEVQAPRLTGGRIRLLLVDDHKVVRDGFRLVVESDEAIEVVGEASDGQEAIELARELRPDVVVMDVSMPRMSGVEATRRIIAMLPQVHVIGLSMHHGEDMAESMLRAGASTYLSKDGPGAHLLAAIRACRAAEDDTAAANAAVARE